MGWKVCCVIPLVLLILNQGKNVSADFGLTVTVNGGPMITSNVNSITPILNMMNNNLRKYYPAKQSVKFKSTIQDIALMARNITELEQLIIANVSKATTDRTTPVQNLFSSLNGSYDRMIQYLQTDAKTLTISMHNILGHPLAADMEKALNGLSQAVTNLKNETETLRQAVDEALQTSNGKPLNRRTVNMKVSSNLTASISKVLVQMREQTSVLSRTMDDTLKSLAFVDVNLATVDATASSFEQSMNSTLSALEQAYFSEAETIVKRYYASQESIESNLTEAISKLSVFNTNRSLLTLVDGFSEAYTKVHYFLYNRNQTDVATIKETYNKSIAHVKHLAQTLNSNYTMEMLQAAAKTGTMYLNKNINFENCFNKHFLRYTSIIFNFHNAVVTCLNRENKRKGTIPDIVDRFLQQTEAITEDTSSLIASCASYSAISNSPTNYIQSNICLNKTLEHLKHFPTVMAREYDIMLEVCQTEAASSQYRLGNCLETRGNESVTLIGTLNKEIEQCLNVENPQMSNVIEEQTVDQSVTSGKEENFKAKNYNQLNVMSSSVTEELGLSNSLSYEPKLNNL